MDPLLTPSLGASSLLLTHDHIHLQSMSLFVFYVFTLWIQQCLGRLQRKLMQNITHLKVYAACVLDLTQDFAFWNVYVTKLAKFNSHGTIITISSHVNVETQVFIFFFRLSPVVVRNTFFVVFFFSLFFNTPGLRWFANPLQKNKNACCWGNLFLLAFRLTCTSIHNPWRFLVDTVQSPTLVYFIEIIWLTQSMIMLNVHSCYK